MFFNTKNSLVMLSFWNPSTAVDPFMNEVSFNSTQKLTTQLNTKPQLYQKSQALEITLFQLISWHILGSQGLNQLSQSNDDNVKSQEFKLRLPWVETHLDGQGIDELLYLPKPTKYMVQHTFYKE